MPSVDVAPLVEPATISSCSPGASPCTAPPPGPASSRPSPSATRPRHRSKRRWDSSRRTHAARVLHPAASRANQIHQRRLRGRIHPARDPATQPQGPFPSRRQPHCHLGQRCAQTLDLGPGRLQLHVPLLVPPARTRTRQRIESALPSHLAQLRVSARARSAASPTVVSPRQADPARTSPAAPKTASSSHQTRLGTPQDSAQNPPMLAETNRQQRHKVSRNTGGRSGLCVWGSGWVWVSRWVVGGVLWWWWSVDGPVAAVVCDSEVGESFEVDCCGAGGEPLPVFVDASVGASSVVAHEPRDGAFGHGPPSAVVVVEAVGAGLFAGCFEELVVGVDFDGAPVFGGGAASSRGACAAVAAEACCGFGADRHGDAVGAGHGACVGSMSKSSML